MGIELKSRAFFVIRVCSCSTTGIVINCDLIYFQDFTKLLQLEEEHVQRQCEDIIALKPDVVVTEKGVSDLAQHYLVKAGITAIRR